MAGLGGLDALVNNAGRQIAIERIERIEDLDDDQGPPPSTSTSDRSIGSPRPRCYTCNLGRPS